MSSTYQIPRKGILSKADLDAFQKSETHKTVISYIEALNESVVGVKLTDECTTSAGVEAILSVLQKVQDLALATPPVDNAGSRFGNPAFRTFYDKLAEAAPVLHAELPGLPSESIKEVSVYFQEAWGSRTRIDYGSGMELNFLCWLICLQKLGVVHESDARALVLRVFWRYIEVMRVLQSSYWLEPAGSHGVWGLDDYHFLPFLFGAAQLKGHKYFRPKSIHDPEILDEYSKDYMYFACIKFINSIKSASLRWHSPMLDDISGAKSWEKVNTGMQKMYLAEVLGKLPVIQHFLFGSLLPYPADLSPPSEHEHDHENDPHYGHNHAKELGGAGQREVGWGDCCGIPVPSAFGAAVAEGKKINVGGAAGTGGGRLQGKGIRPVPFD
ncbi:hypothetical protein M422DRAFT_77038 [Sphaerobolus stellatus SS14]|uniref:Serine/threonine-protein phosphatase 2A activator n=1 Tax=Sphaerobolus stellatus (strain SS14) TaxID=990650 RepID=A0A0C9TVV6_SPHS4|nr:hypothetical protein M422DRAFT_77038 [Sphaerobolus stellatus SS14]